MNSDDPYPGTGLSCLGNEGRISGQGWHRSSAWSLLDLFHLCTAKFARLHQVHIGMEYLVPIHIDVVQIPVLQAGLRSEKLLE